MCCERVKTAGLSLPVRASLVYGPLDATAVDGPANKPAVAPPLGGNDCGWIGPTLAHVPRSRALGARPARILCVLLVASVAERSGYSWNRRFLTGRLRPFLLVWLEPPLGLIVSSFLEFQLNYC